MKKLAFIIKNILKFWWWQDIEKSNIFIRLMNLGMALFLSFCLLVWMYGENFNIILKIIYKYLWSSMFHVFLASFIFI
ncbi:hypothetical protein P5F50_02230 [Clostridium perfringens]|nr:hypothetical protein [Clostridium perfringens]MDK0920530.1 hypothetical protein [Clostridium perfringens]